MTPRGPYANPPVGEALVDFQIAPLAPDQFERLVAFCDAERERYPERQEIVTGSIQLVPKIVQQKVSPHGFRCFTEDRKRAFQVRVDGFSSSRLEPYLGWDDFTDEAFRLWEVFHRTVELRYVTRVGVRYVNRLNLPRDSRLQDYFALHVDSPDGVGRKLSGLFLQLRYPPDSQNIQVTISKALVPPTQPDIISVLLDIDTFSTGEFSPQAATLHEMLSSFRDRKNGVFESCITDKAREIFDAPLIES